MTAPSLPTSQILQWIDSTPEASNTASPENSREKQKRTVKEPNTEPRKKIRKVFAESQKSEEARREELRWKKLTDKPRRDYWKKEMQDLLMAKVGPTTFGTPERADALKEVASRTGMDESKSLKRFQVTVTKMVMSDDDHRIGNYKSMLHDDETIAKLMNISCAELAKRWEKITMIERNVPNHPNTWTYLDKHKVSLFLRDPERRYITLDDFQKLTQTIKSVTPKKVLAQIEARKTFHTVDPEIITEVNLNKMDINHLIN